MKFSKDKGKVLLQGENSPKQWYRLGNDQQESSSASKDLGVLGDSKLYMSSVYACNAGPPHAELH